MIKEGKTKSNTKVVTSKEKIAQPPPALQKNLQRNIILKKKHKTMKNLAEKIFIELIKVHESDNSYMKATKNHAKEKGLGSIEILARIAWECAEDFKKVEEQRNACSN